MIASDSKAPDATIISIIRQAGGTPSEPPVHIRSGAEAPTDPCAAVPYMGCGYWIDDTDVPCKRVLRSS